MHCTADMVDSVELMLELVSVEWGTPLPSQISTIGMMDPKEIPIPNMFATADSFDPGNSYRDSDLCKDQRHLHADFLLGYHVYYQFHARIESCLLSCHKI